MIIPFSPETIKGVSIKNGRKAAAWQAGPRRAPSLAEYAIIRGMAENEEKKSFGDYELSGIEVLARGVAIAEGKILLCRPKKGGYTYLPGGHVEFGETSREALVREMREETGLPATAGDLLGVVESQFEQNGKRHCEISLVYRMSLGACPHDGTRGLSPAASAVRSQEDWIDFAWWPLADLDQANLLPPEIKGLISSMGSDPIEEKC